MKNEHLLITRSVLLLLVLLLSCPMGTLITEARAAAAAPEEKATQKNVTVTEVKKPEMKPGEIRPAEMKPEATVQPAASVNRNTIGCVFPMTGRFADAGNTALDAVLLSAQIFNQRTPSPWTIVVADSHDTPQGIREAVAYLADEAKVMAIIAIAGTAEASEAAAEAQKRKVPLILIASKESVTEAGEYIFQHFLTPTQQMEALAKYAGNVLNVAIFSILYPQDDYGQEMVRLFRSEIQKRGGRVIQAIPYSKTQTDFTEQIKKLTGQKTGGTEKINASTEEAKKKLSVDFEALFIPDSYLRVKMIAAQLAFYDVRGIKLLGTSLWQSAELLKKGPEYLEGAVFTDSFLVDGVLPETNDFVDVYYAAYSREPGNIEALSYDTIELILSILEDRQIKTRDEFVKTLLAVQGFRGVTGSISFGGHRVAQKEAFILRVHDGKIEQVR